uniref:Uncharacterized protein n=1 Tax=Physcomitrium patens TaxID=3218 RepID=A0A2K1J7Q8_PHYPA|nr:hypothetical protein PHYPA_020672 [Physcomitrium patens]
MYVLKGGHRKPIMGGYERLGLNLGPIVIYNHHGWGCMSMYAKQCWFVYLFIYLFIMS